MEVINPYIAIIGISLIIILSYFFNIISQKTNVPSVLMLIVLGILMKQGMNFIGISAGKQLFSLLELLGIVGLTDALDNRKKCSGGLSRSILSQSMGVF